MKLNWEDVAVAICCGSHCNAANHGPDNEMSAERYCKRFGCESDEIYKSTNAVIELVKAKSASQQSTTQKCAECDCNNPPDGCNWIGQQTAERDR